MIRPRRTTVCHCFAEAVPAESPAENTASPKQWHTLFRRAHIARRAALLLLICAGLAISLGGCTGYQVGHHTLYPNHIRTVYVPMFSSPRSFRRNLGEQLTEAVMKEIDANTAYKVVGTPNADSTLIGEIVGESKRILVHNLDSDPREVQVNLEVQVRWIDNRRGTVLHSEPIDLPAEMTAVGASANVIPEVGQSIATAHQQSMRRIAQQIVGLMEAPW